MDNLNKLINNCPIEIIYLIMSYTYNHQPSLLCDDIKNYYISKIIISEIYYQKWIICLGEPVPEDKNWLLNDIICYINDFQPTMYGYRDRFFKILQKNIMVVNNNDVNKYYNGLERKPVELQINLLWGLLTLAERNDIIFI
jgi:hypothetical protein